MHAIFYAKIVDDKHDGVYVADVYFGGLGLTAVEADAIAKDCVNTIKGGTIIPKIVKLDGKHRLIAAMVETIAKFRLLERDMFAAEEIIDRGGKRH